MDANRFDDVARLFAEASSRRTILGSALGVAVVIHGPIDTDTKRKKKKKRKKKENGSTPPPPGSDNPSVLDQFGCEPGEVPCPGRLFGTCCPEGRPVCGPEAASGEYNCCQPNTKVCQPGGAHPVGLCCPVESQCCPPSYSGTSHCCPPNTFCTRGRQGKDESGGCCQLGSCEADSDCPGNQKCSDDGCCAKVCPTVCRNAFGDEECCESCDPPCPLGMTCCAQTSDGRTNECLYDAPRVNCRLLRGTMGLVNCPPVTVACCYDGIFETCWGGPGGCEFINETPLPAVTCVV